MQIKGKKIHMYVKDASCYLTECAHGTPPHMSLHTVLQAPDRRPSGEKHPDDMGSLECGVIGIWSTQERRSLCWWAVGTTHQGHEKTPRWVKVWDVIQGSRQLEVPAMLSWTLGFWDGSHTAVPSAHTSSHL